jgi:AcrR family transcriptional regulator
MSSHEPPATPDGRLERGLATRRQLLDVAAGVFARRGYEAASIEEVMASAGVSRGAVYHHFSGKEALFEAVVEDVVARVAAQLREVGTRVEDPREGLRDGCRAWIGLARDPVVRQVMLLDAPSVIGWQRLRALDERHALGLLREALELVGPPGLAEATRGALAHALLAALGELAQLTAQAEDPAAATAAAEAAIDELLARLVGPAP